MRKLISALLLLFCLGNLSAQESSIPGDNVMRFYRLAIPVTLSSYEQDLNADYSRVKLFWQECEEYLNNIYVPLGFCFDVIEDERLVLHERNLIDENIYNAPSF